MHLPPQLDFGERLIMRRVLFQPRNNPTCNSQQAGGLQMWLSTTKDWTTSGWLCQVSVSAAINGSYFDCKPAYLAQHFTVVVRAGERATLLH